MEPEVIHLERLRPASVAGRNFSVHQALAPVGNSVRYVNGTRSDSFARTFDR